MPRKNPFPAQGEFTMEELDAWLNTLDVTLSIGILEKLYLDVRDYSLQLMEHLKTHELEIEGELLQ